ncbi:hypothetical protein BU15DRAFT_73019 [Melanogaster broomeanus]|nr:hypothetical protein BU15DRAFT_73019 [Melanogaster broomeanus]
MRQTRPLPDTHPEFSVIEWPGFCEYRVENWRLARNGSGKVIRGATAWSWLDPCLPLLLSLVWTWNPDRLSAFLLVVIVLVWAVWSRCNQVLHESVLVFPAVGIQLETHRGHPSLEPLLDSEGWNVRYYLAALKRSNKGDISIQVAFENILPYFSVLQEQEHHYLFVNSPLSKSPYPSSSPSLAPLSLVFLIFLLPVDTFLNLTSASPFLDLVPSLSPEVFRTAGRGIGLALDGSLFGLNAPALGVVAISGSPCHSGASELGLGVFCSTIVVVFALARGLFSRRRRLAGHGAYRFERSSVGFLAEGVRERGVL